MIDCTNEKRKMALITLNDKRLAVMLPFHVHRTKKLPSWYGVTALIPGLAALRF
jgi:hypothetical protein